MRYAYTGPLTSATLDGKDTLLHPGTELELDPESNYTKSLLARGWLQPVPQKKSAADATPVPTAAPPLADAVPFARRPSKAPKSTNGRNSAPKSADTSKIADTSSATKES